MDTAFLRIKFTPLLKDLHRGESKCYLEIVPEVSAIQNLDKVEWTVDDGLVEYTIPMTYKIIIKKPQSFKHKKDVSKVYHSCVDLLHTYSIANLDSPYGDVTKIISDSFFLSRITSDSIGCNFVLTKGCTKNLKQICDKQQNTSSIHTIEINDVSILTNSSETVIQQNCKSVVTTTEKVIITDDIGTHTEALNNNKDIFDIMENDEDEVSNDDGDDYDDHVNASLPQKNANYKSKLTLSPICSVNTYDNCSNTTSYKKSNATSTTEPAYDSENNMGFKISSSRTNGSIGNNMYAVINRNVTESGDRAFKKSSTRTLPDVRVAHFVQVMEKEIFPLKLMLNEIRVKCVSLGVLFNEEKHNMLLYKNVSSVDTQWSKRSRNRKSNETRICNIEKSLKCNYSGVTNRCKCEKSNRVVYTIVFDESD